MSTGDPIEICPLALTSSMQVLLLVIPFFVHCSLCWNSHPLSEYNNEKHKMRGLLRDSRLNREIYHMLTVIYDRSVIFAFQPAHTVHVAQERCSLSFDQSRSATDVPPAFGCKNRRTVYLAAHNHSTPMMNQSVRIPYIVRPNA